MLVACLPAIPAPSAGDPAAHRWTRLGGTGISAGFAGPAGDAVERAWFSPDGVRLHAILRDGEQWTSDDEGANWQPATEIGPSGPQTLAVAPEASGPRPGIVRNPYRSGVSYALGEHLYRSEDGGGEWVNLTQAGGHSVIGPWQTAVAISPLDPSLIVVANSMGLWKSYDEGATWSSLNANLPNFPAARFLPAASGSQPALISASLGVAELIRTPAGRRWRVTPRSGLPIRRIPEEDGRGVVLPRNLLPPGSEASRSLWEEWLPDSFGLADCKGRGHCAAPSITAVALGTRLWAGTSDGRIWVSADAGGSWNLARSDPDGGPVASLWADPALPFTALAVSGGQILRTTDGGATWFDIGSNLRPANWSAIRGHAAAGSVYAAGPEGVYFSTVRLDVPGPAGPWQSIGSDLPGAGAADLELDASRGRLYALVPGFGVFWTRTLQADTALRILSAADLTERPAAPGTLLTVVGASALSARAGGLPAPILDRTGMRTQLQLPYSISGQSIRLQLAESDGMRTVEMALEKVAPAIFVVAGEPLLLDAGTGALVGWSRPASAGGTILVLATGLGEVDPAWPAGLPSPERDPPRPVAQIAATLNGSPVEVLASHLASGFTGLHVVEVAIPSDTNPGTALLAISADGQASNTVSVVVSR